MYAEAWAASPLAILTLSAEGEITSANPASERVFSLASAELVGSLLVDFAHRLDRGALQHMLDEVRQGRVPSRQEIRFETPGRGEVVTGLSLAPTEDRQGRSISVLRDLSKEKAFRPQLLHTERMATMGMMASVVAHELNNALAGAMGCIEMAEGDPGDTADLLRTARSELERASILVKDLKEYARVEDGMSDHIDIASLCARTQRLHFFHRTDVALVVSVPAHIPALRGSTNQLLQALLNLIRNAEYATPSTGESPTIQLRATAQADVVWIDVIDHGRGISQEQRGLIFDPFYSTKPAGSGTGLGLTVVQAIAAAHGGRIEILDTPGGGATFRLVLPVAAQSRQPPPPPPRIVVERMDGSRILIAEDEPAIRKFLKHFLERLGAELVLVADGQAAVNAVREADFDVVLLDLRMPGMGGVAAFRQIRDVKPHLAKKTVFMTGEFSLEMTEIVGHDYAAVVHKPFKAEELAAVLHGVIRGD
jgi:PAS domain S-box-containing protein